MRTSRRRFLKGVGGAALVAGNLHSVWSAAGESSRIALGLELYTVDEAMKSDFDGTLEKVAAMGYREVEFPWFYDRSAKEIAKALESNGMRCRSGLFSWEQLQADLPAQIDFARALGVTYMGCVMIPLPEATNLDQALDKLTLDDFRRYAERFNHIGEQARKAGLQFTYHNHDFEFRKYEGVVGYDELLRLTEPELVQMEMDVGWVEWGGYDPIQYLRKNPGRVSLLHVRDLRRDVPVKPLEMHSVEVGRGVIDWSRLFAAARDAGVQIGYVEQDPGSGPDALESARISFNYLRGLKY